MFRLHRKHPKVLRINELTGIDPERIVSKCNDWFRWVDEFCLDGNTRIGIDSFNAIVAYLGRGHSEKDRPDSLAKAFVAVQFLEESPDGLVVPQFDAFFNQNAKRRGYLAKMKSRGRSTKRQQSVNSDVDTVSCSVVSDLGLSPKQENATGPPVDPEHARLAAEADEVFGGPPRPQAVLHRIEAMPDRMTPADELLALRRELFGPNHISMRWIEQLEKMTADYGVADVRAFCVERMAAGEKWGVVRDDYWTSKRSAADSKSKPLTAAGKARQRKAESSGREFGERNTGLPEL